MNIEVADTRVATRVATTTTRKIAGSKAEPDPMPLRNAEYMKRLFLNTTKALAYDLVSCDKTEVDAMVWLRLSAVHRERPGRNVCGLSGPETGVVLVRFDPVWIHIVQVC